MITIISVYDDRGRKLGEMAELSPPKREIKWIDFRLGTLFWGVVGALIIGSQLWN